MLSYFRTDLKSVDIKSIGELTRVFNIRRLIPVSCVFVLFQLFNLINNPFANNSQLAADFIIIILTALIYSAVVLFYYERLVNNERFTPVFYYSYWLIMFLAMIPYFMNDITYIIKSGQVRPMNITLFCAVLVIAPVLPKRSIIVVFGLFLTVNIAIALPLGAPVSYHCFLIAISAAGGVFANVTQYQNLNLIWGLCVENRIDSLTGILNRKTGDGYISTTLELCKRYGEQICVYMVDIDYFKNYNDHYGHIQGDEALKLVARGIESQFSRSTDIVCRFGGEEFVVCSPITGEREAAEMADKLLKAIENLRIDVPQNGVSEYMTVSIGYCIYKPDPDNLKTGVLELIEKADTALYIAKREGRNRVGTIH